MSALTEEIVRQIGFAGIQEPVQEHRFDTVRKWRFDLAWPSIRLAFEAKGGAYTNGRHTRGAGFEGDIEKYNEAALLGWVVLRGTRSQIESGQALKWIDKAISQLM